MSHDPERRAFLGKVVQATASAALASSLLSSAAWGEEAPAAAAAHGQPAGARPNFIFINTDQQRYDTLRCYGSTVSQTPNIDRLAAEGVRFARCFNSNPVCMPSRASWATGQYPGHHGVWQNGVPLNPKADMLQTRLKDAGYHTACIGKLHLDNIVDRKTKHPLYGFDVLHDAQGDPFYKDDYFQWLDRQGLYDAYLAQFRKEGHRRGYTRNIDEDRHMTHWVTGHAEQYLHDRGRDRQPFFLHIGYFDPHHPFDPCEPYASMFDPADMPMPLYKPGEVERMTPPARAMVRDDCRDEKVIRGVIAAYHAMITHIDTMVGRLMAALREDGLEDNTIVIFTSDHGEMLGDHSLLLKGPLFYEGAARVPLIYRFPARYGIRGVDPGFASHVDLAPTVAALAGIDGPGQVQGVPLFDHDMRLRPVPSRDCALVEWCDRAVLGNGPYTIGRCLVTDDWKFVYFHGQNYGELYDRKNDPQEFENRWADPACQPVVRELRDRLVSFMIETEPRLQRIKDF